MVQPGGNTAYISQSNGFNDIAVQQQGRNTSPPDNAADGNQTIVQTGNTSPNALGHGAVAYQTDNGFGSTQSINQTSNSNTSATQTINAA